MLPIIKTNKECSYLVVSTVLSLPTCINTRIFIAVKTYFWVKEKALFFTMAGVHIFAVTKYPVGRKKQIGKSVQ